MSVHILGASHASAAILLVLLKENDLLYSAYSSSNHHFLRYDAFLNNFKHGDMLVSFSPIKISSDYISKLIERGVIPSKCILISSTSIFSKVSKGTADSSTFVHFKDGEDRIKAICHYSPNFCPTILRLPLLWDGKHDKNISFIKRFSNKFRFFPICGQANGLRAPLHVCDLANVIFNLLSRSEAVFGFYNLMGLQKLSYLEMIKLIQSFIPNKISPLFLFVIPSFLVQILITISKIFGPSKLLYFLSALKRQESDLVYSENSIFEAIDVKPSKLLLPFADRLHKEFRKGHVSET